MEKLGPNPKKMKLAFFSSAEHGIHLDTHPVHILVESSNLLFDSHINFLPLLLVIENEFLAYWLLPKKRYDFQND